MLTFRDEQEKETEKEKAAIVASGWRFDGGHRAWSWPEAHLILPAASRLNDDAKQYRSQTSVWGAREAVTPDRNKKTSR